MVVHIVGQLEGKLVGYRNEGVVTHETIRDLEKQWRRYKVRDSKANFEKALAKILPQTQKVTLQGQDLRLETNRLLDEGSVYRTEIGEDYAGLYDCLRLDEHGETINADGIPTRLINCITGVPYPEPPEGQHRYRVSIMMSERASFLDYHRMWMAPTPREAGLQAVAFVDSGGGLAPEVARLFIRGEIESVQATDVDSGQVTIFSGKDCQQTGQDRMITKLFDSARDGKLPDPKDLFDMMGTTFKNDSE